VDALDGAPTPNIVLFLSLIFLIILNKLIFELLTFSLNLSKFFLFKYFFSLLNCFFTFSDILYTPFLAA